MLARFGWQPGFGDPTGIGWFTTALYLLAAALCAGFTWRIFTQYTGRLRMQRCLLWASMAAGLLFLGLNKQLDLQTWVTAFARELALQGGWYDLGQRFQTVLVVGFALTGMAGLIAFGWWARHEWRHYWLLLIGWLFLGRFILVRAATIWGVPIPQLSRFTGGLRINNGLEVAGIGLITLVALKNLRSSAIGS
jgi:hypothetical protein